MLKDILSYGIGTLAAFVLVALLFFVFIRDITQKKHSVLRNYPIVGRFRYFFEQLGEYFRQYFFAGDRDEMPFNRATRGWVYRLAKNEGGTIGFGATYDLHHPGALIFVNHPFPALEEERLPTPSLALGQGYRAPPFESRSIVNARGPVRRRRLRHSRARLHVRAGLHPGAALPPEHVPDRRHHAQQAPAARAGGGGEVPARRKLRDEHEQGTLHDRALV